MPFTLKRKEGRVHPSGARAPDAAPARTPARRWLRSTEQTRSGGHARRELDTGPQGVAETGGETGPLETGARTTGGSAGLDVSAKDAWKLSRGRGGAVTARGRGARLRGHTHAQEEREKPDEPETRSFCARTEATARRGACHGLGAAKVRAGTLQRNPSNLGSKQAGGKINTLREAPAEGPSGPRTAGCAHAGDTLLKSRSSSRVAGGRPGEC